MFFMEKLGVRQEPTRAEYLSGDPFRVSSPTNLDFNVQACQRQTVPHFSIGSATKKISFITFQPGDQDSSAVLSGCAGRRYSDDVVG